MDLDNKDTNGVVDNNGGEVDIKDTTPKTYTEQDIQNSFNAGVKKANSEWQKDEKYKEFLNWKKSNQNDTEKMKELETNNTTLTNEVNYLKAQLEVASSNVKKEFMKFVTSEVMSLTNETTDIKTVLENYKKQNPHFFGEVVVKKVQSSPSLNGGEKGGQTTNDIMNNLLRNRG